MRKKLNLIENIYEDYFEIGYNNIMKDQYLETDIIIKNEIGTGIIGKENKETQKENDFEAIEKKLNENEIISLKNHLSKNIPLVLNYLEENVILSLNDFFKEDNTYKNIEFLNEINLNNLILDNENLKKIYKIKSSPYCVLFLEKNIDIDSEIFETRIILINYFSKNNKDIESFIINDSIEVICSHPKKHFCIAYGTNNGEIGIIDFEIKDKNKIRMKSNINELFHYNKITNLE